MRTAIIAIFIIMLSSVVYSQETYKSCYYDGYAPITIDGIIDDWNCVDLEWCELKYIYTSSKPGMPENANDLSASFKCFCDNEYLYVTVKVNDDSLVFGQEIFEQGYMDDSVEIYFDGDMQNISNDGYDSNDGYIRIMQTQYGETSFEGIPMISNLDTDKFPYFYREQYPYVWYELGVNGCLKTSRLGYIVEMAIPKSILNNGNTVGGAEIGFHVIVNDDDDGFERECKIGWAIDENNTTWQSTRMLNTVVFHPIENKPVSNRLSKFSKVQGRKTEKLLSILNYISENNYDIDSQESHDVLLGIDNELLSTYIESCLYMFSGKAKESINGFNQVIEKCENEKLELWIDYLKGLTYFRDNEFCNAANEMCALYNKLNNMHSNSGFKTIVLNAMVESYKNYGDYKNAAFTLDIINNEYFMENKYDIEMAKRYEDVKCYEKAYTIYDNIENSYSKENDINAQDNNEILEARLGKARIFYKIKFYNSAIDIVSSLIESGNNNIVLRARILMLSIEETRRNRTD